MRITLSAKQLFNPLLLAVVVGLVLGGLLMVSGSRVVNALQQETEVTLVTPTEAYAGELITVTLVVNNAQNLAGYQGLVRYDADYLTVAGVVPEKGLTLSGRDMMPLEPVRSQGVVFLGAGTCPVSDCSVSTYNSVPRFTLGVDGYVELSTLQFLVGPPGSYDLLLENVQLVDPQGNQLSATVTNTTLNVISR